MTKTNEIAPENNGDFAAAVIKLYDHAVKKSTGPFEGNISRQVRQAAFGLALLRQLVQQHAKSIALSKDLPSSGIGEALGILDHLITGKDHPIARHINGIHSGRFRQGHPANAIENEGRKIVVAVVRAYAKAANTSQLKARQVVVAEAAKNPDCNFTEHQIKKWDDRFRGREGAPSDGPDVYAAKLSEAGDATEILALGLTWIWKLWAVPCR
jgi:hypothetical protein